MGGEGWVWASNRSGDKLVDVQEGFAQPPRLDERHSRGYNGNDIGQAGEGRF